jgi:hypothetical protein
MIRSAVSIATATLVAALCASTSASAQVANTNQKGSLLVFPLITIQKGGGDTLVELSNDANANVQMECTYVNEEKGRVDFDFNLTAKQTVSWDVGTRQGDHVVPPQFPTYSGGYPGDKYRGELICFATTAAGDSQIAWNELTGDATVMSLNTKGANQARQAFKYNAWSFCAESAVGVCAPDNATADFGTPGDLVLAGAGAGTYDACPAFNIVNFMANGGTLGNTTAINNTLSVASCNQDLREQYTIHTTKLDFTVWNSDEDSFSGAYACVDSVESVTLGSSKTMVDGSNFSYSTLQTPNARFQVQGIAASPPCKPGTEPAGLLTVEHSEEALGGDTTSDVSVGSPAQTVGMEDGFVLWDPLVAHRK